MCDLLCNEVQYDMLFEEPGVKVRSMPRGLACFEVCIVISMVVNKKNHGYDLEYTNNMMNSALLFTHTVTYLFRGL